MTLNDEQDEEKQIFGMTGGSPDVASEKESIPTQSNNTSDNKSYFDPPIENYRRFYKHVDSRLSSVSSKNGQA